MKMAKKKNLAGERHLDFDLLKNAEDKEYEIEYSLLSGYNFYKVSHDKEQTYLGIHVQSGSAVRITIIGKTLSPLARHEILWHQKYIWKSMPQEHYEWPIDLIEYQDKNHKFIQCYVFPLKAYPKYIPIRELLYQEKISKRLDWRNEEIKDICRGLLSVFDQLHNNGYYYNDFCIDRIYFEPETKEIFLRYTHAIRAFEQKPREPEYIDYITDSDPFRAIGEQEKVNVNEISIEFAPPYIYEGTEYCGNIDDYSIASMLFRLMIGRLPYEGKGLSGFGEVFDPVRDVDVKAHEWYFEHYHQYPKFIFDSDDNSNSLGLMSENDFPRDRWEKLPDRIKEMFQESLSHYVQGQGKLYSPKEWLKELNHLCWNEQKKGQV